MGLKELFSTGNRLCGIRAAIHMYMAANQPHIGG